MSRLWLTNWQTWESRAVFCLSSVKYGGSEFLSLYFEQISEVTRIEFFLRNSDLNVKEFIIFHILQKSQVVFLSVVLFHALFLSWGQLHVWAGSLSDRLSSAQKADQISSSSSNLFLFNSASFFQQHHFLKNYSDTNRQNVSLFKFTTPRIFGSLILGKKRRLKIAERIKVSICLNEKRGIYYSSTE